MKYKFNFDKWVINNFGTISTATISKEERDFFMKTILKHNGEIFLPNEGSRFVGEISINIGSFDNQKNMITYIEAEDCDLYDDSIEQEFNEGLAWFKEHSVPMRSPLFLDKDGLENTYGKSILSGVLPEAKHVSVPSCEVDKVYPNEKKGITCVVFKNGDKRILKASKKEPYCVETAVAYAIAEQVYGSNSAFTKAVQNSLPIIKAKKKFSYDLWKERNKSEGSRYVEAYDKKTINEIKEVCDNYDEKDGFLIVDGEFSIDLKKDLK